MIDMTVHVIRLDRYCAKADGVRGWLVLGTWASYGIEQLQLVLGDGWDGRTVTAVFHGPKTSAATTVLAGSDGLVNVPQEATAAAGYGTITIVGVDADSQRISVDVSYMVMSHAPVTGQAPDPTPDQWQQFVAAVKADADRAEQAAGAAADSAAAAAKSAEAADESAQKAEQAGADIGEAKDAALEVIQQAQTTGVQAVEGAATEGVQAVQQAHQDALDDIATDRNQALADIEDAGDKQTAAITSGGAAALEAIGQVEQTAINQVQQAGAKQVDSVNTAGNAQLDKINAANALVPTPMQADAGKAVVVKSDGSGYELGDIVADAYTKAESNVRYAPIAAAIRPTVSGNPATLEHSVAWAMQGLNVYGKSTQDGTPSPDSPVPIVSAGESGSIAATVSDGADQSQQLTIITPNGFPGIPVDSGGNFTDASSQQWICDEVDFERGVYVQRTSAISFNGTEDWLTWGVNNLVDGLTGFYCYFNNDQNQNNNNNNALNTLLKQNDSVWGGGEEGFNCSSPGSPQYIICTLPNDILEDTSTNELAVQSWKNILAAKGMTAIFTLVTPTETTLSAEALAAYAALHTYDGTTVVSTDAPVAGLTARYVADGAAYIDEKFAALSAAMLGG